jgi:hypothetical protein
MIWGTYHGLVISDQNPCSNGKKMDHDEVTVTVLTRIRYRVRGLR